MKGGGHGLVRDLVIGAIGTFLGGRLFGVLGIGAGGLTGSLRSCRSMPPGRTTSVLLYREKIGPWIEVMHRGLYEIEGSKPQ